MLSKALGLLLRREARAASQSPSQEVISKQVSISQPVEFVNQTKPFLQFLLRSEMRYINPTSRTLSNASLGVGKLYNEL